MMASQPTPPPHVPLQEITPCEGLARHWFPLIRAAIKPLFLGDDDGEE